MSSTPSQNEPTQPEPTQDKPSTTDSDPEQTTPPGDWMDPTKRQTLLNTTGWAEMHERNPAVYRLTEMGLPQDRHRWRSADKFAYMIHLRNSGDSKGVARAFGDAPPPRKMQRDREEVTARNVRVMRGLYTSLQHIVQRFEPVIRKRSDKKHPNARTELFKKVWVAAKLEGTIPLPEVHRPDLRFLRLLEAERDEEATCSTLLPLINVEDLTQGNTFLRLLNSRARNEPARFVYADLEILTLAQQEEMPVDFFPNRADMSSDISEERTAKSSNPMLKISLLLSAEGRWVQMTVR